MYPFHTRIPSISEVTLGVTNVTISSTYYQDLLGLEELSVEEDFAQLGYDETTVLTLRKVTKTSGNAEGLYHVAFIVPDMPSLASWLEYHLAQNTRLLGASDHGVSRAIYLSDPDGNGVEVYADTPENTWRKKDKRITMVTEVLNSKKLLEIPHEQWENTKIMVRIGHVHVRAKDLQKAEEFYRTIGMNSTFNVGGATFLSYAGYHHHLAVNSWGTRSALPYRQDVTGLLQMTLSVPGSLEQYEQKFIQEGIAFTKEEQVLVTNDYIGISIKIKGEEIHG